MSSSAQPLLSPNQGGLTEEKLIQTYSADEWEAFITEWMTGFSPPYQKVVRLGGAGDKGRDVVGYVGNSNDPACEWDNYQCKHYDHLLAPGDIWVELGKLCVFTFLGNYTVPRQYCFVAPRGVGTSLHDYIRRPEKLRSGLIENWGEKCAKKISRSKAYPLEGALLLHVRNFDFSIVDDVPPSSILEQHRRTRFNYLRFKREPPQRPPCQTPPAELAPSELPYVTQLLQAYEDHVQAPIADPTALHSYPGLLEHFRESRGYFYAAESLGKFSREAIEEQAFGEIKQDVYDGVCDVARQPHPHGYACVLCTTSAAAQVLIPQQRNLARWVGPADKKGLCHHLVNDEKMRWVRK